MSNIKADGFAWFANISYNQATRFECARCLDV
jgi:hypothetical protein